MECRRYMTLELGRAREIILGEVLALHVRSDAVDPSNLHIDSARWTPLGGWWS